MTSVRDESLVGRTLNGRYKIGERIARGGMASVFLAEDVRLDRTVAVKVMHQDLGDEEAFLERFNREAKAAAKLNHRGVVSVFDQGTDGDITYLVMEYVPGSTLRDVMRNESPMSPARSLEFLAGTLVALSAAHAAGIIHRDIKPENVLITPEGEVKVADFGLARAISANTATNGTVMGTVSYLAPEIVSNQSADARSDVYACGAMLYEMLTGAKPHSGDTPIQVAYRHVHEDIGKPSATVPGLPDYVDALVARTTDRDPIKRPADARGLLQLVRLVQRAIEQGLANDPELVAELRPPAISADEALTIPVAVPVGAPIDAGSDGAATEMFPVAAGAAPAEATVQWSTGEAPPRGIVPAISTDKYREDREGMDPEKRGKIMLAGVVAAALIIGLIGWYWGAGRYEDTPMLIGLSESQAVVEAKNGGYTLEVSERAFSETAPLGTIISTDPEPGGNIMPGDVINAVVSKGKERYAVPEVRGLRVEEAARKLEELHLVPGQVTEDWSNKVEKGRVRNSAIDEGTYVKRGTKIDLVVSKGREPITVRSYVGSTRTVAVGGLQSLGFRVAVVNGYSDSVAAGRVMGQTPSGGTAYRNDTIRITVSLGPQTIKVPGVVGMSGDDAAAKIEAAGLNASGGGEGTVVSQSPGSGAEVKRGSSVTITVQEAAPEDKPCTPKRQRKGLC